MWRRKAFSEGFPQDVIRPLRAATTRQLIAAGGIRTQEEIDELDAMGVDAVVGMAIYQGLLPGFVTSRE